MKFFTIFAVALATFAFLPEKSDARGFKIFKPKNAAHERAKSDMVKAVKSGESIMLRDAIGKALSAGLNPGQAVVAGKLTVLPYAVSRGKFDMVRELVTTHGVSINSGIGHHRAIFVALKEGNFEMASLLVKLEENSTMDISFNVEGYGNMLHYFVKAKNEKAVYFIQSNFKNDQRFSAMVEARNKDQLTPIHLAERVSVRMLKLVRGEMDPSAPTRAQKAVDQAKKSAENVWARTKGGFLGKGFSAVGSGLKTGFGFLGSGVSSAGAGLYFAGKFLVSPRKELRSLKDKREAAVKARIEAKEREEAEKKRLEEEKAANEARIQAEHDQQIRDAATVEARRKAQEEAEQKMQELRAEHDQKIKVVEANRENAVRDANSRVDELTSQVGALERQIKEKDVELENARKKAAEAAAKKKAAKKKGASRR